MPGPLLTRSARGPDSPHHAGGPHAKPPARVVPIHAVAVDGTGRAGVMAARPDDVAVRARDRRGRGGPDAGPDAFDPAQGGDDPRAVLDASGRDGATVAGCSMDGCVTQAVAVRPPRPMPDDDHTFALTQNGALP